MTIATQKMITVVRSGTVMLSAPEGLTPIPYQVGGARRPG